MVESGAVMSTLNAAISCSAPLPLSLSSLITFIVSAKFVGVQLINIAWIVSKSIPPAAIMTSTLDPTPY